MTDILMFVPEGDASVEVLDRGIALAARAVPRNEWTRNRMTICEASDGWVALKPPFCANIPVWCEKISEVTRGCVLGICSGWDFCVYDRGHLVASMTDVDERMGVLTGNVDDAARLLGTTPDLLRTYAAARARGEALLALNDDEALEAELSGSLPSTKAFPDDAQEASHDDGHWSFLKRLKIFPAPVERTIAMDDLVPRSS